MSKPKLTYFHLRARAELARLVLAQAGVDYEDNRVTGDSWKAFKPKCPFGQLPVLEIDGEIICQSFTIARLLAKRYGLGGNGDLEQAKADMIVDSVGDIMTKMLPILFQEKDEAIKAEKKAAFVNEWLPDFVKHYERLIDGNAGSDWIVGKNITYADLALADIFGPIGFVSKMEADWRTPCTQAGCSCGPVYALPNIKKWVETRPDSSM